MSTPTVACVLRASRDFRPEQVARLYAGVRKHWTGALDFVCLTDTPVGVPGVEEIPLGHPWPGYWAKLALFEPGVLAGPVLYFDLDTMIVGPLTDIAARARLTMLRALNKRGDYTAMSGLMLLPEGVRGPVWGRWIRAPKTYIRRHVWGAPSHYSWGDQGFLEDAFRAIKRRIRYWQQDLPGQVESYRKQVAKRGAVGRDTRVVYFHGSPRPWEIGWKLPAREAA